MNERIKELAEQAVQLVANEHTKGDVSRLNTDAYHVKDLINEKFAELIVKECSAVANHFSDGHEVREFDDSKRYLYFVDIGKVLLEHFGIEDHPYILIKW